MQFDQSAGFLKELKGGRNIEYAVQLFENLKIQSLCRERSFRVLLFFPKTSDRKDVYYSFHLQLTTVQILGDKKQDSHPYNIRTNRNEPNNQF